MGFSTLSRPDIGLRSDGFSNLSEIFDSDKRGALDNILLTPESLDEISGLSDKIDREDLRAISGLPRLLLPSLHQSARVFRVRIPIQLFVNKQFYSPQFPLGGLGSSSVSSPNTIIFNGSIQCERVQYRSNVIGQNLFSNPSVQTINLSSSRGSLFTTEFDPINEGYYSLAKLPSTLRVRRRSHINRLLLPKTTLLNKAPLTEKPTHLITVPVSSNNGPSSSLLDILATKNTPLKVFCRVGRGTIKLKFTDNNEIYYFGCQVQPLEQIPNRPLVDFINIQQTLQATRSLEHTVTIDLSGTGFQNNYDLYLYLYVNPEKVKSIEFADIDIREAPDGRDLGLIGFNNLEEFTLRGGSMTVLPLWMKTLGNKLRTLDVSRSRDSWRFGPLGWFDRRNPDESPLTTPSLQTAVGYLTLKNKGPLVNSDRSDWANTQAEKYIKDQSRTPNTDYRVFSSLTTLSLGDKFLGFNPRLDDVFPNLTSLFWGRENPRSEEEYRVLWGGKLPRINNNGSLINYNIFGSLASGSIQDIGTSADPLEDGHVSKYRMRNFNIAGRRNTVKGVVLIHSITGFINNPVEDWSRWRQSAETINIDRTGCTMNLQSGRWESLRNLQAAFSPGLRFNSGNSAPIDCPRLTTINLFGSGANGRIPSLGANSKVRNIDVGGCQALSLISQNGTSYILPEDFAPPVSDLTVFSINVSNLQGFFRQNDFINCPNLVFFQSQLSRCRGRFFKFPVESPDKSVTILIRGSDFYDLSSLNVNNTNLLLSRTLFDLRAFSMNLSGGGCVLPTFEGVGSSRLSNIELYDSCPSAYPSNWDANPDYAGRLISDQDPPTSVSGMSITRRVSGINPADSVFILNGGASNLNRKILVNDTITASGSTILLGRVLSVRSDEVIIDRDIESLPATLVFSRSTNNITTWFGGNFRSLTSFKASNCRLSGTLNIKTELPNLGRPGRTPTPSLDLSSNGIDGYVRGSIGRVFKGAGRRVIINLSRNNLNLTSIRTILEEVIAIEKTIPNSFSGSIVNLSQNKVNNGPIVNNNLYSSYTANEIFTPRLLPATELRTEIFRNEVFNIYEESTTTNSSGVSTTTRTIVGTKTVSVPGQLVEGVYWKTRVDQVQSFAVNPLLTRLRALRKISVNLGLGQLNVSTPPPTIVSTAYENSTTRTQSIIDAGENPLDLVNP